MSSAFLFSHHSLEQQYFDYDRTGRREVYSYMASIAVEKTTGLEQGNEDNLCNLDGCDHRSLARDMDGAFGKGSDNSNVFHRAYNVREIVEWYLGAGHLRDTTRDHDVCVHNGGVQVGRDAEE